MHVVMFLEFGGSSCFELLLRMIDRLQEAAWFRCMSARCEQTVCSNWLASGGGCPGLGATGYSAPLD